MNTIPKELRKQLKDAIEKLNLPAALEILKEMKTDEVVAVLHEKMTQPGAYQIRGNRSKRNKFYDSLLSSSVMTCEDDSILPYLNEINEKIKKIEMFFDEIHDSLPKCDISQFPGNIQFWSHVERASREITKLNSATTNKWGMIGMSTLFSTKKIRSSISFVFNR